MSQIFLKNKKLISSIMIIVILAPAILFSVPGNLNAAWWSTISTDVSTGISSGANVTNATATVTNTAISIKKVAQEIVRQVLMTVASRLLKEMTKSTLTWINEGYWGNPLFVENPKSFFKDIVKYEVKNIVDMFGYDSRKFPYGKSFALNTINSYKQQLADNAEYTLNRVIADPELLRDYRTDFNTGGWNGFMVNNLYPQNNYVGFNMIATEALARKVQGVAMNAGEEVQDTLDKGMGFLSPQNCPTNPAYNSTKNQFQRPVYNEAEYRRKNPFNPPAVDVVGEYESDETQASVVAYEKYVAEYNSKMAADKSAWAVTNDCPGGLVATTPGSVVGNSVMNALTSGQRLTELGATMGNSISSVIDALLNKFIGSGLNALASKANPPADDPDTWDYYGNTLGSPSDPNSTWWDAGPDEVIVLSDFKKTVDEGIANTTLELKLMSNESATEPGITQMMASIWPKVRELDLCLPGPDLKWEERLQKELERNSKTLSVKTNDGDGNTAAQADLALRELNFAVSFFKDWMRNKMLTELPSSVLFLDAVDEIEELYQESDELTNRKRAKTQALARLQAVKNGLATITTQPAPGSGQEKILIELKKQYSAVQFSISYSATIVETRSELNVLKDKWTRLNNLTAQCMTERVAKGWTNSPTGSTSTYLDQGTEQNLFCDFPIKGGYPHDTFRNTTGTHPEIPLVNAKNVLRWPRAGGLFGNHEAHIQLNCNLFYKSNVLDYKDDLPGGTPITEVYQDPGNDSDIGDPDDGDPDDDSDDPDEEEQEMGNLEADVRAERSKYGARTSCADLANILLTVAWNHRDEGWGVSRKTGGARCSSPVGDIAFDILHHRPTNQIVDVFASGGDGEVSNPQWDVLGTMRDPNRPWVAPVQP